MANKYHVIMLVRNDGEPMWRSLGEVEAANPDLARQAALGRERIETATAVAVPLRSWKPEVFTTKSAVPRYVKGTAAVRA